jgi:hypothetical protein
VTRREWGRRKKKKKRRRSARLSVFSIKDDVPHASLHVHQIFDRGPESLALRLKDLINSLSGGSCSNASIALGDGSLGHTGVIIAR